MAVHRASDLKANHQGHSSSFRWLETVDEALELMIENIEQAKFSIRLEIYIFRVSPIGERFREVHADRVGVRAWRVFKRVASSVVT